MRLPAAGRAHVWNWNWNWNGRRVIAELVYAEGEECPRTPRKVRRPGGGGLRRDVTLACKATRIMEARSLA